MNNLADMIWVEMRKAVRSRMPIWTTLGSLFMPLGIAFLIFVARNPEISKKLGLVSAKANLIAYSATDWPTYLGLFGQIIAAGGFFLFILSISWVFGREFVDGTLKDMLAIPVPRSNIVLAKYIVTAGWSVLMTIAIFSVGLGMGVLIKLPGGSLNLILQSSVRIGITAGLVFWVVTPFAFLASAGRGYLLPIGVAVLILMMTNMVVIAGWGEYFPWALPLLLSQSTSSIPAVSYLIVGLTGLAGIFMTYFWWMYADQNR